MSPQTLYSIIKRNNLKIDFDVLMKICKALDVPAEYFYNVTNKKEPPAPAVTSTEDSRLQNIIECYHEMNEEGQEKVATYIADLVDTGKYKKLDQFHVGVEENVRQA